MAGVQQQPPAAEYDQPPLAETEPSTTTTNAIRLLDCTPLPERARLEVYEANDIAEDIYEKGFQAVGITQAGPSRNREKGGCCRTLKRAPRQERP